MRIYSVLPNIFGGQSVDQFGLTATSVYRFPSCPAAALPLIFQTQKSIRLFACKTTMQTERLTVLSSPAIPYRFAATSLYLKKQSYPIPLTDAGRVLVIVQRFFRSARTH